MVYKLHPFCKDNAFVLAPTSPRVGGVCMGLMRFGKSKWVSPIAQSSISHRGGGHLFKCCMPKLSFSL